MDIVYSKPLNLKNYITIIEHKKIFCGTSKILKNVSWPINICLKYCMTPTKTFRPLSYILHVQFLMCLNLPFEVKIQFLLFSIFDVLRIFEALQLFFYKFLLKRGINEEGFESSIFFEAQTFYCFKIEVYIFFQMVLFATLFRHCPTL